MAPSTPKQLSLMIIAGESSGDAHAAALVRALRAQMPDRKLDFFGATGPALRGAGVDSVVESDRLSIIGWLEIGRALPKFWRAFKALKRAAIARKPDAVILVDWPDFNLRIARACKRLGIRVIYYISPQLWAWRAHRIKSIKRDVDLLLVILPFEESWYRKRGVGHVQFTGHPLADEVRPQRSRNEFCLRHDLDPDKPLVALLAGSRHKELLRNLPPMLGAAHLIARVQPDAQFVIALAPNFAHDEAAQIISHCRDTTTPTLARLPIVQGETYDAIAAANVAAVASGTATLETALLGTPMTVVYKVSALNWYTLRPLIKVDHFALVNLIAEARLATELIQHDFTPQRLAEDLLRLMEPEANLRFRTQLNDVTERLGHGGATGRGAAAIVAALDQWRQESDAP